VRQVRIVMLSGAMSSMRRGNGKIGPRSCAHTYLSLYCGTGRVRPAGADSDGLG
jgi:hypothetical protein